MGEEWVIWRSYTDKGDLTETVPNEVVISSL